MLALIASLAGAAPSTCEPNPLGQANVAIAAMDRAMFGVDEAAFDEASAELTAAIGCVTEVPPPSQVAALHRGMALAAFVNGQISASKRSLAAVRRMDPEWQLSGVQYSPSHPYRALVASARDSGATTPLARAGRRTWVVDGEPATRIPTERAFLLQQLDHGRVVWTRYLWTPEEVPAVEQPGRPPYPWIVSADLAGAVLQSRQDPGAGTLPSARAGGVEAGAAATVRFTPSRAAGVEGTVGFAGPAAATGGLALPAGQLVVLLGSAWDVAAPLQLHAAGRVGTRVETLRTLLAPPDDATAAPLSTVSSLVLGAEIGLRGPRFRATTTFDLPLARAYIPHELAVGLGVGARVAGPLALEGVLGYRPVWLAAEDDLGNAVGTRTDTTYQLALRVALWLH